MKALHIITCILLIVGGLNWGLVGLFDLNVVDKLLGAASPGSRIVYTLVGVSALWKIIWVMTTCGSSKSCGSQPT
ncbi:MAG TPA: DUF378 domain-containing protein [Phycisphaerae bacterium]|nr:DUF378 domain-containing protein [Phycisphaerae bacterium]